jgi:hypothetical protein
LPTFSGLKSLGGRKQQVPPKCWAFLSLTHCVTISHFNPEGGSNKFFQNVGNIYHFNMVHIQYHSKYGNPV